MRGIMYYKMMDQILRRMGMTIEEVTDPAIMREMENKISSVNRLQAALSTGMLYDTALSSAILISYMAYITGIEDISPAFDVDSLRMQFENKKRFSKNSNQYPRIGDIVFFMEKTRIDIGHESKVGIIYRTSTDSLNSKIWVVSTNFQNEINAFVMNLTDSCILGYGIPYYGQDASDEFSARTLSDESKLLTDETTKYCGRIISVDNQSFYDVKLGPGNKYVSNPWYPKIFVGNYVEVRGTFSDQTPGNSDLWLFVKIDSFCYGYIKENCVAHAKFQTVYPSGPVAIHDVITLSGGRVYSTAFATDSHQVIPGGRAKIIEMNLYSPNPYKIRYLSQSMYCDESAVDGWVRPDMIYELR